jgi:hypothetical protein
MITAFIMTRLHMKGNVHFVGAVLSQSVHGRNTVRTDALMMHLCSGAEKAVTGKIKLNACVVAHRLHKDGLRSGYTVVLPVNSGRIEKDQRYCEKGNNGTGHSNLDVSLGLEVKNS